MTVDPLDIATTLTPALSDYLRVRVRDADTDEAVTRGAVRNGLAQELGSDRAEAEQHHFGADTLLPELDRLIDRFGEAAPANEFVAPRASEGLSRVIRMAMTRADPETRRPTLGMVRRAVLEDGLAAGLVGKGELESDALQPLVEELDRLIGEHGEGAPAEPLLRYG